MEAAPTMSDQPTHDALAIMVAAYALDALDPADAAAVEAHLPGCPDCRDALAEARETAGALALAVDPVAPPSDLRARVLAAIAAERAAAPPPPPADLAAERRRRRPVAARVLAAATGVAAAVAITFAVTEHRRAETLRADRDRALAALAAPGARVVALPAGAAGSASVVVSGAGTGLVVGRLGALADGQVYQLWAIPAGSTTPTSLGLLSPSGVLRLDEPLPVGTTIAVSIEPAGGSPAPTTTPIGSVGLS
jgi:anti-sigma-K factor RskA